MRRVISLFLSLLFLLTPCLALAESNTGDLAERLASEALIDFLRAALDSDPDLNYDFDEESLSFSLIFESSDGQMGNLYSYIDVYGDGVLLQVCYETDAPGDRIPELVRFVNMLNADLLGSKYYVYTETGSIYCESFLEFGLVDLSTLTDNTRSAFFDCYYELLLEADFDAMYFAEIIAGETAENGYAIYLADLDK